MPSKYMRRTTKASWTEKQLQAALNEIRNGRSTRSTSKTYGIPRATLYDRLKSDNILQSSMGRNPVFTKEEEALLAEQVLALSKMYYGITGEQIKRCAFMYAEKNKIKHPFSRANEAAGQDWLRGFLRRNPTISLRKPEATSINRVAAFNKVEVTRFFDHLSSIIEKYSFDATRIFNADETGITTVQKPIKIYAKKGQKQVGIVTSAERGKITTVTCAMSASGMYVPPHFIYARKRLNDQLKRNGPPGAKYSCSDNGWTNEELYLEWLVHFTAYVKPSKDRPVLLIIDNHGSHCTLDAYNYCKENGIVVLTLPPHTSHRLQPLDVTFFGPLKTAYNTECTNYLRTHQGQRITTNEVAELLNKAFSRTATPEKAASGFRATGIFPLDPNIFTDDDFAPARVFGTNQLQPENDMLAVSNENDSVQEQTENSAEDPDNPDNIIEEAAGENISQESFGISFAEIMPIPGPSHQTKKNASSTRKQHSEIFTSTPMKDALEAKKNKRLAKQAKKSMQEADKKGTKRRVFQETEAQREVQNRPTLKRKCKEPAKIAESSSSEEDVSSDDDQNITADICIICGDVGKHRELWLQCGACGQWAHEACADYNKGKHFVCDFCA